MSSRLSNQHLYSQGAAGRPRYTPSPPYKSPSCSSRIKNTWLVEIAGFVIGAGSLAGTYVLLRYFDGKPVPKWPVTLEAILVTLGNVASAATLAGVRASVAQQKWLWYHKRARPISKFSDFQKGSRGGFISAWGFVVGVCGKWWYPNPSYSSGPLPYWGYWQLCWLLSGTSPR